MLVLLANMHTYFKFASREPASAWESQLSHFETFFRKLPSVLPENVRHEHMISRNQPRPQAFHLLVVGKALGTRMDGNTPYINKLRLFVLYFFVTWVEVTPFHNFNQ